MRRLALVTATVAGVIIAGPFTSLGLLGLYALRRRQWIAGAACITVYVGFWLAGPTFVIAAGSFVAQHHR